MLDTIKTNSICGGKRCHTHITHFLNYRCHYVFLILCNLVQPSTVSQYVASTTLSKILQEGRQLTYHAQINSPTLQPISLAKETGLESRQQTERNSIISSKPICLVQETATMDHTTPSPTKQRHSHTLYMDINIETHSWIPFEHFFITMRPFTQHTVTILAHFSTTYKLLARPSIHNGKQRISPTTEHGLE